MEEIKQTVARIDENLKLLRDDVSEIKIIGIQNGRLGEDNKREIALLKNDKKWANKILSTLIGLVGVILGALAEYFRK